MEALFFKLGSSPVILNLDLDAYIMHHKNHNSILKLMPLEPKYFNDGEFFIRIPVNVRNHHCYLVVDMTPNNIFEVLITIDTFKKASASKVTLIAPYLPYSRQDRRTDTRTPMSAKVLASMLETAGVDHIITMDVHALQIECFYNIPFDNLQGSAILIEEILNKNPDITKENTVMVAPDAGSAKRTRFLAEKFGFPVAIIDKKRISDTDVRSYLIGDVKNKNCLMLDDIISSGGTIMAGCNVLKDHSANRVLAGCIHILSSEDSLVGICNSNIDSVYALNTRNVECGWIVGNLTKLTIFDASYIFADAIDRDSQGISVSSMFNQ